MPRAGSKVERYPYQITSQLTDLRDKLTPKVTINKMANHFAVGRETVTDWENGYRKPRTELAFREAFLLYLLNDLKLSNDVSEFERIWQDIMVELWEWQPISDAEFTFYLPSKARARQGALPLVGIPRQRYKLIGRQELVPHLRRRLMQKEMVALLGLPGVGKTALAVALTRDTLIKKHFVDGIFWVGLGRYPDVLSELKQLAPAFDVKEDKVAAPAEPASWAEAIHHGIGSKHILIILDDVWQSETANLFTFGGQNCAYLMTTRIPEVASDFSVGQEERVPELAEEDAFELLSLLAGALVTDHSERAITLAKLVGYLPLALILMGNYLRNQTLIGQQEVIEATFRKLSDRIERLQITEAQRSGDLHPSLPVSAPISLMAMLEISDQGLDRLARSTLRALSVFPPKTNTFSAAAAIAIAESTQDTLNVLYQAGLLELDRSGRFTLHQVISDYARANLQEAEPYKRFVDFFADYVDTYSKDRDSLKLETTNILTALEMAPSVNKSARLVTSADQLYDFLEYQGLYKRAEKILIKAVAAARVVGEKSEIAKALRNLAAIDEKLGEWGSTLRYHLEALSIVRDLGDIRNIIIQLSNIAVVLQKQGRYVESLDYLHEGLALAQKHDLADVLNGLQINFGVVYINLGQYELAQAFLEESLPWARQAQRQDRIIPALGNLGWLMEKLGRYTQASDYYQECLAIAKAVKHRGLIAKTWGHLGTVRLKQCLLQKALKLFERQKRLSETLSEQELLGSAYSNLGQAYMWAGSYDEALAKLENSLPIARNLQDRHLESEVRKNLGEVWFCRGDNSLAFLFLKEALSIARKIDYQENISSVLSILGTVSLEVGEPLEKVSAYLVEAASIAYSIQHQELTAYALLGLVRMLIQMNDDEYAQILCDEGKTIAQQISHKVLSSALLVEQGRLHLRRTNLEAGYEAFENAYSLVKDTELQPAIALAQFALAKGYQAINQKWRARQEATQALKILQSCSHMYAKDVQLWLTQFA